MMYDSIILYWLLLITSAVTGLGVFIWAITSEWKAQARDHRKRRHTT